MKYLIKLLINALAILVSAYVVPGIHVSNFLAALALAGLLSLLNTFIKPLFILLTLPFTLFSFGIFLLFVNTFMILIADYLLQGFNTGGFWNAFMFSLLLWLVNSLFDRIYQKDLEEQQKI